MAHHYKAYCHKHLNYSTPLNRIIFNNISQVLGNHRDCVTQAHPNDCDHIHNFWVEQPSFFMCGDIYRCWMTKRNADSFFRLLLIIWCLINSDCITTLLYPSDLYSNLWNFFNPKFSHYFKISPFTKCAAHYNFDEWAFLCSSTQVFFPVLSIIFSVLNTSFFFRYSTQFVQCSDTIIVFSVVNEVNGSKLMQLK